MRTEERRFQDLFSGTKGNMLSHSHALLKVGFSSDGNALRRMVLGFKCGVEEPAERDAGSEETYSTCSNSPVHLTMHLYHILFFFLCDIKGKIIQCAGSKLI